MLELTVEKIDSVPEAARGFYVEKDGKFHLQVSGVEDVSGLKSALQKEREAAKAAAAYKALGKSPDEIKALLDEKAKADEDAAIKAGDFQKALAKRDADLAAARTEAQREREARHSYRIEAEATRAIAAAKGEALLLLPHVQRALKVITEDGRETIRVVDDAGEPRRKPNSDQFLSVEDFLAEMRAQPAFARAFDAPASGGGKPPGSNAGGGATKTITLTEFNAMSAKNRAALMAGGNVRITD